MGTVRWLVGGSARIQSAWVCRERGSGATDAAQSLITHRLGGIVTCAGLRKHRNNRLDSNNTTLLTFLLSLSSASKKKHCANCRTDDSLMFSAGAAAPACLQERVGCVHVRYLFVELLQLRVNAILVSLLDAPDNPVQVQVHTSCTLRETWITFQVVSRHKGFSLVVTPDTHDHHLPHCSW